MEFYWYNSVSQLIKKVSIPNGMEFYQSFFLTSFITQPCFNSQRDGILLDTQAQADTRQEAFQFPTGWNSTERKRIQIERVREVSIPNGMEFYSIQTRAEYP